MKFLLLTCCCGGLVWGANHFGAHGHGRGAREFGRGPDRAGFFHDFRFFRGRR